MGERKAVIFCSASYGLDPKYGMAAREAVRALHALNWTIVSGGSFRGTMGDVAEEAYRCGGRHIGVIPRFMTELVWTDTMSQRKEAMRAGTRAAIALPGGIGTLDELIETHVLAKLGRYDGRLYALNLDGFYEPFKRLLDHYVAADMLDADSRRLIRFPETVEEMMTDFCG